MYDEVQFAINRERQWRLYMRKMDRGSYSENPSQEYVLCSHIVKAYQTISESLLKIERCGLTPAPFQEAVDAGS